MSVIKWNKNDFSKYSFFNSQFLNIKEKLQLALQNTQYCKEKKIIQLQKLMVILLLSSFSEIFFCTNIVLFLWKREILFYIFIRFIFWNYFYRLLFNNSFIWFTRDWSCYQSTLFLLCFFFFKFLWGKCGWIFFVKEIDLWKKKNIYWFIYICRKIFDLEETQRNESAYFNFLVYFGFLYTNSIIQSRKKYKDTIFFTFSNLV